MHDIENELFHLQERNLIRGLGLAVGTDFASNDYLGFSKNERIRSRVSELLKEGLGLGSTGSRLISGNNTIFEEVEQFVAELFHVEAALFFGSGYLANLGVVSSLGGTDTIFFSDEKNHASLIDGMRLSGSKVQVFRHNDISQLEGLLKRTSEKRAVIVTESVFSMDGDFAPLNEIEAMAQRFGAYLVVDEAHATGTCGDRGLGMTQNLRWPLLVSVHTGSKALGGYGAFVCCSLSFKKYFINRSRSLIFSTALPPILVAQTHFALKELIDVPEHVSALRKNIELSQKIFSAEGFRHSGSPIIPFLVGDSLRALHLGEVLQKQGFFIKAIRYPSVPEDSARLRITLKSFNKEYELSRLAEALRVSSAEGGPEKRRKSGKIEPCIYL